MSLYHVPFQRCYTPRSSVIRGCAAAPVLCQRRLALSMGGQFLTPHRIHTPWPITKNLLLVITPATPTAVPNLLQIRPRGGFWTNGWNITKILLIYLFIPFCLELTYRSDPSKDFHACGSNDADSHKDVPFGGLVHIAPRFGGETPKKQFLGRG